MRNIQIFKDVFELASALVAELFELAEAKQAESFHVAISGGKTPEIFFGLLADRFDHMKHPEKIHFWWVDERMVSPDMPESNFGRFNQIFLQKVNFSEKNIHRIKGENAPPDEAISYSDQISQNLAFRNGFPTFDLVLLGLGDDGHTASLFPNQLEILASEQICEITEHPLTKQQRITLTYKTLNNANEVIFVVTGREKAERISEIFNDRGKAKKLPAAYIHPVSGKVSWFLDEAAARFIQG